MAAFTTFIAAVEHVLNNILNYGSWGVRSWGNFVLFIRSVWPWILNTVINSFGWSRNALAGILAWLLLSGGNIFVFVGFILGYLIVAALDYLNWLGFDLPDNLIQRIINGLVAIGNFFISAWNFFLPILGEVISQAFELAVYLWNLLIPFLADVWGYVTIFVVIAGLFNVFVGLALAVINLLWMIFSWLWANIFMIFNLPLNFYYAFDTGVRSEAFSYLMSCAGQNFWCALLAGVQLLNQVSSHSIVYPIVIVGIIIGSIAVFWKELWALFDTAISWRS
jgi:hypothetical protein